MCLEGMNLIRGHDFCLDIFGHEKQNYKHYWESDDWRRGVLRLLKKSHQLF